ncbi:hypothetical protein RlegWSM1455_27840 (plasmid) [Rhizobium laguerreae]|uniref:hypothetical protein n=1 Tax=Rhizobium laguerreae TaxID=1076926 RepID=UPI001E5E3E44|nr:hypothetical protein [Rhizobium laguerreae]UFW67140.1 hypothetical protein RlegWSM1455_27840 [Rhizobium laguerreae]
MDNAILAENAAERELVGIHPLGSAETALYDQTKSRIAKHIFDAYGDPFSGPDEDYIAKERDYLKKSIEIERSKKLPLALENGVRVDTEEKDKWPCVVGPYKYVETICPGEAHHIIPDMVYRLGKAPANEAEKSSTDGRIPNSQPITRDRRFAFRLECIVLMTMQFTSHSIRLSPAWERTIILRERLRLGKFLMRFMRQ